MGLRSYISSKPGVYSFRYENPNFLRENGEPHFREISVPVGAGRFQRALEDEAREIAERRLSEAYGQEAFAREARVRGGGPEGEGAIPGHVDPAAEKIRQIPDAHQDGYELVSVERIR